MICPNKMCLAEIHDDSLYCDQCRIQILRCSKCGTPGVSKFCVKCGGAMVFKELSPGAEETPVPAAATIIMPSINAKKLLLCHPDGWNMEVSGGDILGRTNGNHVDRLGAITVISGTHAKITCENDRWFITDLKSTNKTYVGSEQLQPDVSVAIKNNDVIQLANVKFIVREQ
ncbi:FHA domain-containing protein [Treponema primitia]|uniref:FHA domain-containing protein n=1 Tax=Treponema primitia TaxID=88058 RepID=UPI00398001C7